MKCVSCTSALTPEGPAGLKRWDCPSGHGRAVNAAVLRRKGGAAVLKEVFRQAALPGALLGRGCPSCSQPMTRAHVQAHGAALDLDVCTRCQLLWFDAGELEQAIPPPADAPSPVELPLEARRLLAMERARLAKEQAERRLAPSDGPEGWWEEVLATLGILTEIDVPTPAVGWRWCSLALLLACVTLTILALPGDMAEWTFAVERGRPAGHMLASLLLHPFVSAWPPLVVPDILALWAFGSRLEAFKGRGAILRTFFVGAAVGALAHLAAGSSEPFQGLGGAMAAVVVVSSTIRPRGTFMWYGRFGWRRVPIRVPVWAAAAIWFFWHGISAWAAERTGEAPASVVALLGGGVAGGLLLVARALLPPAAPRRQ